MIKKFQDYVGRLDHMTSLISQNATGSHKQFASKVGISSSSLFNYLHLIRILGREVEFDQTKNTYKFNDGYRKKFFCGFVSDRHYEQIKALSGKKK
ncbi:MAG: hypothetical protein WBA74_01855 [Cyclobacteriaceae bacterium]